MRVEIKTSGGFTGRGLGNVTIEDARSMRALIDAALLTPDVPRPRSVVPDSIQYQMTVTHSAGTRTFTWYEHAAPPPAVLALFNAAWATRR